MKNDSETAMVPVMKDGKGEQPVPSAWRPTIRAIVSALARGDYGLLDGVANVAPVTSKSATQIRDYVDDYGETLVALPDEAWATSVCQWQGHDWDVLVDLWTAAEGRSDLVLGLKVAEAGDRYEFKVRMVYVP